MYCVNQDSITLHTFGFDGVDNEILNLNGKRAAKISTKELLNILTSNFKTFNDKTGTSVAFVKNCTTFDLIQAEFLKRLSNEYSGIMVEKITIEPQVSLPKNFDTYSYKKLITTGNLSSNGVFRVMFELPDLSTKNLYFKYSFKAKMPILKALNNLNQGQILGAFDYQKTWIEFEKFDKNSIQKLNASKLMAKSKIASGQTLLTQNFTEISLIKKGDKIQANINEDGVSVIIDVYALQNGNLGDVIMVRSKDRKSYKANIISNNKVIIR
ncbi:flagellar basal body P-ring formation chaperone FlgA [Campylobacter majalis]|uniref:flagellar basal body P-ring formation chaperone FlgA n=1 Tax=Campylobacter majalis TaxID=2790656 RepID=UPI001E5CD9C2|nr:flagellar basal body P-ring formation chaperone FlgA [Campylobacter majalis]